MMRRLAPAGAVRGVALPSRIRGPQDETPRASWSWLRGHPFLAVLLALSLVLLLAHSWRYRFLTDDAFISFRYARNLAEGHGLVFNPGHERVEGYTNLLWVLILAGFHRIGAPIEHTASALSLVATAGLWALVVRETLRWRPGHAWLVLIPPFALAITRSVAVWSTSGLETRLFELLIVAAALRLFSEIEAAARGETPRPWAALWFGLAEWTRPDGLLLALGAYGAGVAYLLARRRLAVPRVLGWVAPCAVLIVVHFAFRIAYYGEIFPNTYYAKVDGRLWWESGLRYLGAFVLEYGVLLWIPLIMMGAALLVREGRAFVPIVSAGMLLPHVLYVVTIGGDHFEYRPLDLIFPFAFMLLFHGTRRMARSPAGAFGVAAALAIIALGLWEIPFQSHRQMPTEYAGGFPGADQGRAQGRGFLSPDRDPILRLPALRSIAELHRRLIVWNTYHYSAIRQEEHRLFLATVRPAGRALSRLLEGGRLPRDLHLAMPCVGVIPFDSGIRTLDRTGLTDAHVAHSKFFRKLRVAHDKEATDEYLRSRGVDLVTEVRPVCSVTSEEFLFALRQSFDRDPPFVAASAEPGLYLVGRPLAGRERLARRVPGLEFHAMNDPRFFMRYVEEGIAAYRERLGRVPEDDAARGQLAYLLAYRGDQLEALRLFEAVAARNSGDAHLWLRLGWCRARSGLTREAEVALEHSVGIAGQTGDLEVQRGAEALLASLRGTGDHRSFDPAVLVSPN